MSDDKYNISDVVNFSAQEKPLNVKNAVNDVMLSKIHASIEAKKMEVAKSLFGGTPSDVDDEAEFDDAFDDDDEDDEEDDEDDFDISDEDLEDLFNDLEDLADTDLDDDNSEVEDENGEDA
jgi:hypothetical protein